MAETDSATKAERSVSERMAGRISSMAGTDLADVVGRPLPDLDDILVDRGLFYLLGYRRICGRVVKRDPTTGELLAVPGAKVEVQDTDCSFLTYSPGGGLIWIYPGLCSRETIATTYTDECGNFCVWVPRWEVDWILEWHKERICFPLERPRLVDFIEPEIIDPAGPVIDPGWIDPAPEIRLRDDIASRIGSAASDRLLTSLHTAEFGDSTAPMSAALDEPAPGFPPPRPDREPKDLISLTPDPLGPVDWDHWIGPFVHCRDVFVPEWKAHIDVPDITFRVTQEIGGSDVVIYSEGLFDVRWNDTSGDVTLEASSQARAVTTCHGPDVPCDDGPEIVAASLMPLTAGFHDNTTGYGLRVNQPSSDGVGVPQPPTSGSCHSPITERLDLFGCAHDDGASHYRLLYTLDGGPQLPLTGFSWPARRTSDGAVVSIVPDPDGWVQIQNLLPPWDHLVTAWPTHASGFGNGTYELVLESGTPGASNPTSDPYKFVVDNDEPRWTQFSVEYRVGSGSWQSLDLADCPTILRGPGEDIDLRLHWQANAPHLRNASVGFSGCSSSSQPSPTSGVASRSWWWETAPATSTGPKTATWTIEPSDQPGCYTLSGVAVSRAYNPSASHLDLSSGFFGLDSRRRTHKSRAISIVDST